MTDIAKCPLGHEADTVINVTGMWHVECEDWACWRGPACESEAEAVQAWNEIAGMKEKNHKLLTILNNINIWCGTDDAAHALPFEPPWYKELYKAVKPWLT